MKAKLVKEFLYENESIRYSGRYVPSKYHFETRQKEKAREKREYIINHLGYLGTFKTIQELKNFQPYSYDWILRSAEGKGSFIVFNGDMMSKEEVNDMKTYYSIDQKLHYFQGRPITYARWLRLPNDLKMASRRIKKNE